MSRGAASRPSERVPFVSCLRRASALLEGRLVELEARISAGDESAWPAYCEVIRALAVVMDQTAPGSHGELITTAQMAARLGLSAKTLLKHKKAGAVKPALQRGKLIRWKGNEAGR